jgi:hypothetical protein
MKIQILICLCCLPAAAGCGSGSASMHVAGQISYQGKPLREGQIIFFPIAGTAGPSTGAAIKEGRYEIDKKKGPYAGGKYRVEITGFGPSKTYSPNVGGGGLTANVPSQIIPPIYNKQTKLEAVISPDPAKNQHDFELK